MSKFNRSEFNIVTLVIASDSRGGGRSAAILSFNPRLLRRPAKCGTPRNDTLVIASVLVILIDLHFKLNYSY